MCDGVLSVDQAGRPALVAALRDLESTTSSGSAASAARGAPGPADVAARLGPDVPVTQIDPTPLVVGVAHDEAEFATLRAAMAEVDEESVRLRQAVKGRDGFFATFFVSPYSRYVARWCARRGLTPNQVTTASVVVALVAASLCATGERAGYVLGALLLQASFVLDCVDGQLARYSMRFSRHGGWLDAIADRVKEYVVFAGLAVGSARTDEPVWALAAAALAFQTVRHFLHFGYSETVGVVPAEGDVEKPADVRAQERVGWSVWLRRAAVLPIGERWLLISVLVALSVPRTVFVALLVTGAVAMVYAAAGRVRRSLRRCGSTHRAGEHPLRTMLDLGPVGRSAAKLLQVPGPAPALACIAAAPLASVLIAADDERRWWLLPAAGWYAVMIGVASERPLEDRLDWTLPALVRAAEYFFVLGLVLVVDWDRLPAVFALLATLAYHHYDVVYRLRSPTPDGGDQKLLAGGHEVRILVVALAAVVAPGSLGPVLLVMTVLITMVNVSTSVRWWIFPRSHGAGEGSGKLLTTMGDSP